MQRHATLPSHFATDTAHGRVSPHRPHFSWRVLIVDDDEDAADELARRLHRHGHHGRVVPNGRAALREYGDADLVLLNLDLPDMDGLEVCRAISAASHTPIVATTRDGDELDCVLGLQAGADDHLVKPYGFRELLARMEAVMRRARPAPVLRPPTRVGALTIEHGSRTVRLHGRAVPLAPKEYDLLELLASAPGDVVSRRYILQKVWHDSDIGRSRTIDTHVNSLRRKLGSRDWIVAVRGVGFRLSFL